MAENKLDVIIKAIKLMEYSMTVTSNKKRFIPSVFLYPLSTS